MPSSRGAGQHEEREDATPTRAPPGPALGAPPSPPRASPPLLEDPLPPVRLERLEELGRGGMGVVYRVRDPSLGREAALKLVLPEAGQGARRRFTRELQLTARLEHPSIPPVYAAGVTARGEPYLLMKLIRGESLARRLQGHDWERPVDEAERRWLHAQLEVLVKVGEAVAHAHERGIVHRDLKPQNVMIGSLGEVLVMDWGLAKDLRARGGDQLSRGGAALPDELEAGRQELTEAGSTLGTPGYMAPEQAGGDPVDERADVFSLGCMLVACLTGRPPFDAQGGIQLLHAAMSGKVVLPRRRRPGLPPELDSIAARALALDPLRRVDAQELVELLRAYLSDEPVAVHRYGARERAARLVRRRPTLLVAATGAALLLGVSLGLGAWAADAARRARGEQVRSARQDAESALAALEEGSLALAPALRALGAAQRWRAAGGEDPAAVAAVATAAQALGEVALRTGQWDLAQEAFSLAGHDARARVEHLREAETRRRVAEVQARLVALRVEGAGPDAREDQAELEIELSRHEEPAVVAVLTGALDELSARLDEQVGPVRLLDREDALAARVVCAALGRIGARASQPGQAVPVVAALERYLGAERDELRAAQAALALCRIGGEEALRLVHAARLRFGVNGPLSGLVSRWLARRPVDSPADGDPRGVKELVFRADRRLAEGDVTGAIEDLTRAIELRPRDPRPYPTRAHARMLLRDWQGAFDDCTRALELDPRDALAWANRGGARRALGDPQGAIDDCTRAIGLDPRDPSAFITRGQARASLEDPRGALADFDRALELDPRSSHAWLERGSTRLRLGDADALEDFTRAIELDPNLGQGFARRGSARSEKGDLAGGLEDLTRAIELAPGDWVPCFNRGLTRERLGDLAGAGADYSRAIELGPDRADPYHARGLLRAHQGQLDGAIEDLERFLRLAPSDPASRGVRAQLQTLRGRRRP